jgi:hypothetical protein
VCTVKYTVAIFGGMGGSGDPLGAPQKGSIGSPEDLNRPPMGGPYLLLLGGFARPAAVHDL